MAINLELPKKLHTTIDQAHQAAAEIFRPVSRKYDLAEHAYPVELDTLASLYDGLAETGQAGAGADGGRSQAAKKKPKAEGEVVNGGNMQSVLNVMETSWGDVGLMLSMPYQGLGNSAIAAVATDEQLKRFGKVWAAMAITEPGFGSDSAAVTTTATLDGDEYVINGHKIWTSYSDIADWCLLLARTDPDVPRHRGISAFIVPMDTPGIVQRPLKMISGITTEFGQVTFDDVRVPAGNIVGQPGDGWAMAMTVVGHEREPSTLGYVARYAKTVQSLVSRADEPNDELALAAVETEMLRLHVRRRLSEQLDGVSHSSEGSLDKLLMTWTEQTVGHAAIGGEKILRPLHDHT